MSSRPGDTSTPLRISFDRLLLQPAVLLGLLGVWLLVTLGWRPLLLPDEGRYVEVTRAMLLRGDAWVPTLDGLPFFHKPPLFYWIDLGAMRLLGVNVLAGRFASALGAWVMGATLLMAMRRWHGPRVAAIALGVLATTPFFFVGGQYANHDMLVGGLISAAVLAFARTLEETSSARTRWLVGAWVLCALAMLAKGLIGIVLPAIVVAPWLLAQRRWREMAGLLHPLGLLAFALVAFPWFVATQAHYPGFFDYFFVEQHFRRFAESTFNNVYGAWFFLAVVPALTLPWSAWLLASVRRLPQGHARPRHDTEGPVGARRQASRERATLGLYLWWVVAVVGFFSIPSSKLVGYVLPALAPWCALLALAVARRRNHSGSGGAGAWPWVMGGAGVLCLAIIGVTAYEAPQSNRSLALSLAQGLAPDDKVVMVDTYLYDVPFYAGLRRPVYVASDWADPQLPLHDNWRKELWDAAKFDPPLGKRLLVPLDALDAMACDAPAVWFVAPRASVARVAALSGAVRVVADPRVELWRAPGRSCR